MRADHPGVVVSSEQSTKRLAPRSVGAADDQEPCADKGPSLNEPVVRNCDRSIAIVTPSYGPDLARCELLAESLDRTAADVPHYLLIDRHDYPAFRHLNGGKRRLVEAEALVGSRFWRMPGRKPFWLSGHALPVRGWSAYSPMSWR